MSAKKETPMDILLASLAGKSHEEQMDILLANLAILQPQKMLQDLHSGNTSPALYNAITALLKYHKIEVDPLAAASKEHPVGALKHGLPPADYLDGHEYGVQ